MTELSLHLGDSHAGADQLGGEGVAPAVGVVLPGDPGAVPGKAAFALQR